MKVILKESVIAGYTNGMTTGSQCLMGIEADSGQIVLSATCLHEPDEQAGRAETRKQVAEFCKAVLAYLAEEDAFGKEQK